ncbi:single-stranded DNA-binding protein 1 [Streptomyces inusitatus]|uniref:Single-stranded DNA-binding protein 1 n=2 Tax=Streptomyces inusitatus TaxID=68221 RepID=A0A918PYM2_9ACTN|nr:single-stranded DNA-binding protein 1 [Streptomyces inusitatus]
MAAMNDTLVTVVGNVATQVEYRDTATGGMARFRIAVTPRRWDRQREVWADGRTSFYTVLAWRTLAANMAGSVSVGDPLLVHGRLRVREEERDASRDFAGDPSADTREVALRRRTFVDIEAVAVGHDLARGTSAFRRVVRSAPNVTERQSQEPPGAGNPLAAGEWPGNPVMDAEGSPAPSAVAERMAVPPF